MAVTALTKPNGPTGEFNGDIHVDNTPPNKKMLEKAKGLTVLDHDKKKYSFQTLYEGKGRILMVFIRNFFCGNCQEYTRTLSADLPPTVLSALSPPTSIVIIGCGSADLIPMYKLETNTPFPIYADPTRKIYDVLGMTKTLSLGDKMPQYMRQPMYRVILQSIVQELKSGKNMFSGGDFWQVGGEFLFQPDGTVSWCHRMKNTRDHAELDELRKTLRIGDEPETLANVEPGEPIGSRRSISGVGLARKLSNRRKSWRNSMIRNRSRNTEVDGSIPSGAMEKLREEDDAHPRDRDAALAKPTGGANGDIDEATTSAADLNKVLEKLTENGTAAEASANGNAELALKDVTFLPDHTTYPATSDGSKLESPINSSALEPRANGSVHKPTANGSLRHSTPSVQSLVNGSIDKKPSNINNSAEATSDKVATKGARLEACGSANGKANGDVVDI